MPGHDHGPSIKNAKVYEGLKKAGYDKSSAAAISNAQLNKQKAKGKKQAKK